MERIPRKIQEISNSFFINIPKKVVKTFGIDKDKNIEELWCEPMIVKKERAIVFFFTKKEKPDITEVD